MGKVGLLRRPCLPLNEGDTWISTSVLVLDGPQRKTAV